MKSNKPTPWFLAPRNLSLSIQQTIYASALYQVLCSLTFPKLSKFNEALTPRVLLHFLYLFTILDSFDLLFCVFLDISIFSIVQFSCCIRFLDLLVVYNLFNEECLTDVIWLLKLKCKNELECDTYTDGGNLRIDIVYSWFTFLETIKFHTASHDHDHYGTDYEQ